MGKSRRGGRRLPRLRASSLPGRPLDTASRRTGPRLRGDAPSRSPTSPELELLLVELPSGYAPSRQAGGQFRDHRLRAAEPKAPLTRRTVQAGRDPVRVDPPSGFGFENSYRDAVQFVRPGFQLVEEERLRVQRPRARERKSASCAVRTQ